MSKKRKIGLEQTVRDEIGAMAPHDKRRIQREIQSRRQRRSIPQVHHPWWLLGRLDLQPPSLRRSAWLWVQLVGGFLIVSNALIEAIVAIYARGLLSYEVIVPIYLAQAIPIALITIARLATQLHVGRLLAG